MREELDELRRMAIFAAVVDAQSFSEAARRLGMAKSAVSKQVSELELALGVRLMNRTTRRLALTEAGERFYGSCSRILAEAVEATQAVRDLQEQPKGTLRLTTSISFGARFVVPHVAEFAESYPEVRFELELTDRYVDLIESNIDLAVRVGSLEDSSLIARKLAPVEMHVVASASMLEAHGTPQTPGDLGTWPAIRYSMRNASPVLCRDGEEHRLRLAPGTMASNNGSAILEFARRGLGVAVLPDFYVDEDLRSGTLTRLLPGYEVLPRNAVYAVYPQTNRVQTKVRLFVDALAAAFSKPPWARGASVQ